MNTIRNMFIKDDVSVEITDTIEYTIRLMGKNKQGVCVIVDNNIAVGIITERDLLGLVSSHFDSQQPIKSILKFNHLITINIKRSIEYALQTLIENNIRRLIIVNDSNHFLGIITQDILIKNLEDETFKKSLLISDFIPISKKVLSVPLEKSVQESFAIMNKNNVGSIIVYDKEQKIAGILTERDTIRIIDESIPLETKVSEVMSSPVITISDNQKVEDVVNLMKQKNITRVVVINSTTQIPQTILGIRDIAFHLKGNYNHILENRLHNVKNTLNYIGESVVELYKDNNEQVIKWANDTAIKNFGNIISKDITQFLEPSQWKMIYQEIQKNGNCTKFKLEINDMFFEMKCSIHYVNAKESLLLIFRDISEFEYAVIDANKKNEEVKKELEILQGVIDQQKSIVFVTNGYNIISANKSLYTFFNVKNLKEFQEKYNNISSTFIKHINFFSIKDEKENWIEEIVQRNVKDRVVSILDMNNFEPKAFTVQINPLNSDQNEYAVTLTDISEIRLESQQYHFHATHDALTEIYNRSYYLEKISNEIAQANRYGTTFCVILFDIDHFKIFNDTYGHLKGDEVLVAVTKTVKKNMRKSDTFARWGGEEFVVLLKQASIDKAELIAEHFRTLIEKIDLHIEKNVTVSFGVTQFIPGDDDNTILKRADDALYKAKEAGRNRVVIL